MCNAHLMLAKHLATWLKCTSSSSILSLLHYTNVSGSGHPIQWIDDLLEIVLSSTSCNKKGTPSHQSQIGFFMKQIIIWGIIEQLEIYFSPENIIFQNTICTFLGVDSSLNPYQIMCIVHYEFIFPIYLMLQRNQMYNY